MISGAHVIVYSKDAEADRAFFRDVLGFKSVDGGHGWLIFALPPGEAAFYQSSTSMPICRNERRVPQRLFIAGSLLSNVCLYRRYAAIRKENKWRDLSWCMEDFPAHGFGCH